MRNPDSVKVYFIIIAFNVTVNTEYMIHDMHYAIFICNGHLNLMKAVTYFFILLRTISQILIHSNGRLNMIPNKKKVVSANKLQCNQEVSLKADIAKRFKRTECNIVLSNFMKVFCQSSKLLFAIALLQKIKQFTFEIDYFSTINHSYLIKYVCTGK